MSVLPAGYRLSEDHAEMQIDVIHAYLARSYWAEGIPRETVERAVAGSHVVGVFAGDRQLGFARVVTDHATFAYLADVFVLEEARGQGLARAMVAHLQSHPRLQGLRRWLLATRDAHPLYVSLGWTPIADPTLMMQRHDPDVYRR
ncbi:GNAT superfamily N-acetyltransferase [Sphingomonas zeicaulis]|uniref:GNAT family N-acetyltransferase n=1 Tax=Sphingomonas zeicaulis TaxID=1632740 RepID=UPI003D196F85